MHSGNVLSAERQRKGGTIGFVIYRGGKSSIFWKPPVHPGIFCNESRLTAMIQPKLNNRVSLIKD